MSQENVEVVMSGYDAVQRGDYESAFEVCDEDIVWDMTGLGKPDLARVYRGHDGLRQFWLAWLAAWETIEFKTPAVEDHEDHVIVEVQQRNLGRGSGVPLTSTTSRLSPSAMERSRRPTWPRRGTRPSKPWGCGGKGPKLRGERRET
jgi:ketosteroid isomerase-like protein